MRHLLLFGACAALMSAPALAAAPLAGLWRLEGENARIRLAPCGRAVCGRLADAAKLQRDPKARDSRNEDSALRRRPLRNILVMRGFTGGPDDWEGGTVYNPDDGSTYQGEMRRVDDDTLEVEVCVIRPLCKTQTLTRLR